MSRSANHRVADILRAAERCRRYATHLRADSSSEMAYDAILHNLAVMGEAVRGLPNDMKSARPDIPWASISGLRNVVVHEYFRIDRSLVLDIVENDLPELVTSLEDGPTPGLTPLT